MISCGTRTCDKDNDMTIREFQHYYLLPLEVNLESFNPMDNEVIGIMKLNIIDALDIILNGETKIGILKINDEQRLTKNIDSNKIKIDPEKGKNAGSYKIKATLK